MSHGKCSEPCLYHQPPRNPRLQGLAGSGGPHTLPPPTTPTGPCPAGFPSAGGGGCGNGGGLPADHLLSKRSGLGMARSISDTTLRKAALHLNLSQSVLPSFTSLQQFKVTYHILSLLSPPTPRPPPQEMFSISSGGPSPGQKTDTPAACLFSINASFNILMFWGGGYLCV